MTNPVIRLALTWHGLATATNAHNGAIFAKRVELCRRGMGAAYLCHPDNRVRRLQFAPRVIPSSLIK